MKKCLFAAFPSISALLTAGAWWFWLHAEEFRVSPRPLCAALPAGALPARLLRLQNVQQELLHLARGQLVQVLGRQVPSTDLQLVLHRVDNPPEGRREHLYQFNTGLTFRLYYQSPYFQTK